MYMTLTTFIAFVVFLLGLYYYTKGAETEGFQSQCPNLLIQKDSKFYLYNSKQVKVPGVNPVEFNNLEDYTEFLEWQRSKGIRCPVLYLQQIFDAQGNPIFKVRPSVSDLQGGLPSTTLKAPNKQLLVDATRADPPYNKNSVPGFDPTSYYVGTTTPLDTETTSSKMQYSADPMDSNWGGPEYTKKQVEAGYYKDNEVSKQRLA
jgi:hypothetical protein